MYIWSLSMKCSLFLPILVFVCVTMLALSPTVAAQENSDSLRWAQRTQYALSCVEALKAKDYALASQRFAKEMRREITLTMLENFWKQFLAKCGGELYELDNVIRDEHNTYYWVYPSYKAKKDRWQFRIGFDDNDSISAFHIDRYLPPPQKNSWRLPSYVAADSVTERQFIINKDKDYETTAFLTIPTWKTKVPCVIFVHDAGPWDKDASRYSNKPFFDLAWGLATHGIASVRIDKRTYLHYKKIAENKESISAKFDTEEDIYQIISQLITRKDIDADQLFLIGQGVGATICPRIIQNSKVIKGAVLLAPYGRQLEDALLEEFEYVMKLDTLSKYENKKKAIEKLKNQVKNVKSPTLTLLSRTEELPLETPASYWLDLKNYDCFSVLKKTNTPALILRGERDYRTSQEDFDLWKKRLDQSMSQQELYTFISYPLLNNIFMPGEEKSSPLEYHEPKNVSKQVVDDISKWVWKIAKGK
jgi:dienelactone hydrolase